MIEKNKIIVSNIVPRGDKYKEKGEIFNKVITEACHKENIPVINHNNINPKRHLNRSKLHFNNYGNSQSLLKILEIFLSNLTWRDGRNNSDYMQNPPSLSISLQNSLDISETSSIFENDLNRIKRQRPEYFNSLTVGHLKINSIRNKFEMIAETITNFDVFLISESKIDSTFPNMQFKINKNYKMFLIGDLKMTT